MPAFAFRSFVFDEAVFDPMVEYSWTDTVIVDCMDTFVPLCLESPCVCSKACKCNLKGVSEK